ncbi:MAG: adenylate/guanylate cyclase domain-containing protein [Bacteroidetes bacterium]|nr:adenylate/guanylate cyclase domain-containing protein [Bacteroidota bacterium]
MPDNFKYSRVSSHNLDSAKIIRIQKSLEMKLRWLEDMQQMEHSFSPGTSNEEEMMKAVMLSLMGNFGYSSSFLFLCENRTSDIRIIKRYGGTEEDSYQLLEILQQSLMLKERNNDIGLIQLSAVPPGDKLAGIAKNNIVLVIILPVEKMYCGIILFGERLSHEELSQGELSLVSIMASNITSAIKNYRLTTNSFRLQADIFRTRGILEQFVAPEIVEEMLNSEKHFHTKGERKLLTILSADIRGFTAISERNEPEHLVSALNRFYSIMSDIISKHSGIVDKFIGDAVLALFRLEPGNDPVRAISAALDMHKGFEELIKSDEEFRSVFESSGLGIGISTGEVIVGNFGSGRRMDYTVIGRSVNLSARLCGLARANETLVDVPSFEKSQLLFNFEELTPINVKGIEEFVQMYKVI